MKDTTDERHSRPGTKVDLRDDRRAVITETEVVVRRRRIGGYIMHTNI